MSEKGYEEKLLLLTKAMDKELQEAQLRALKAEAEVERLREDIDQHHEAHHDEVERLREDIGYLREELRRCREDNARG